jgi:hypothetical protein
VFRWSCALHCTQTKSFGFHLEVRFRVDVGGVDGDVAEPRADGVDVDAKKMRGCGVADGSLHSTARAGETVNIPSNAPHQFKNVSSTPARMICICSPAGNERFFLEIGVPVATRTTPPPSLDEKQMAEFLEKVKTIAPKYRTELLRHA